MPEKRRKPGQRKHQEIKKTGFNLREEAGRLEGQGHQVTMGPTLRGLGKGKRHRVFGLPHRADNMTGRYLGWIQAAEKGPENKTAKTHWFVDTRRKKGKPAHRKRKTK